MRHSRRLPMPSTDAWCTFNEQRRATALSGQCWDDASGILNMTIESKESLPGGTLALPAHYDGRQVVKALLDGEQMELSQRSVAGVAYVLAVGDFSAGAHEVAVHYQ